jgi:hypothetical protein
MPLARADLDLKSDDGATGRRIPSDIGIILHLSSKVKFSPMNENPFLSEQAALIGLGQQGCEHVRMLLRSIPAREANPSAFLIGSHFPDSPTGPASERLWPGTSESVPDFRRCEWVGVVGVGAEHGGTAERGRVGRPGIDAKGVEAKPIRRSGRVESAGWPARLFRRPNSRAVTASRMEEWESFG